MKFRISNDARPQAVTLLVAALISIALWFIPFAEILSYPFRIFVTFIHEGGHALAALITGNSVRSLSVATFVVSLLAVQCVLNALLDLKTVFFLSSPFSPSVPTDAVNMAHATHVPAFIWSIVWIAAAIGILVLALRFYVAGRERDFEARKDFSFESAEV